MAMALRVNPTMGNAEPTSPAAGSPPRPKVASIMLALSSQSADCSARYGYDNHTFAQMSTSGRGVDFWRPFSVLSKRPS